MEMRGLFAGAVVSLLVAAAMVACSGPTEAPTHAAAESPDDLAHAPAAADKPAVKLAVFVSILPQAYFVERIGGDNVDVDVLVLPGENPATYNPSPKQMAKLARARLYFRIGVPFETAIMPKLGRMMEDLQVVDTRRGVVMREMAGHHGHACHEGGLDPHIWLAPSHIKTQARNIAVALEEADPLHAHEFEENLAALIGDIDATDARIQEILKPCEGRTLYVFHPAYGYFAEAYGLRQMPVEIEGKNPSPRELQAFVEKAKAENVDTIFVQPQFDRTNAAQVARSIGGAVVPLDPLAKDVLKNLEAMAAKIKDALTQ